MASAQVKRRPLRLAARQRGQAMLLTVLLLGVGISAVIYTLVTPAKIQIETDNKTALALAQAKDALIGRAATDDNRPGSLPCPDLTTNIPGTNVPNDGIADLLVGNECPSYVGRLPWRTLGLGDLRDGSGERLWYALSRNFRDDNSAQPINSGTVATLTVTGTIPASNVIAIVFSPGANRPNQTRAAVDANTAANYLDEENAVAGTTTFHTKTASDTFNDRLLPITRESLFPVVEMRVARELRLSLAGYYAANQFYPHAAPFPGSTATEATYRGYPPTGSTPACNPPTPDLLPYLPAYVSPANQGWFVDNGWQQYMVYAVAPRCTARIRNNFSLTIALLAPPPPCSSGCINLILLQLCLISKGVDAAYLGCKNTVDGSPADSWLTVGGTANVRAIVMPASYPLTGQPARPCAGIANCLEAVGVSNENIDGVDNYVYAKPARSPTNNDTLVIVAP
jgi:hypothetical protein